MRRYLIAITGAALLVVAAAASSTVTITDDAGRRVAVAAPARRVVSLAPAHTETLYALGAGARVVAADTYSTYPPAAAAKAKLNCWPRPPVEQIVAQRPDLVVVLTEGDEFLRRMEALKIPTLKLFPETVDRSLEEIALLGRLTGTEKQAARVVGDMRRRIAAVKQRVAGAPRPRVLFEMDAMDAARPFVAGPKGFYGQLLALAGGENVFNDLNGPSAQVSAEQVLARDPEVILMGDTRSPRNPQGPELLRKRPGWSGLSAVKSGRVFPIDSDRITRPGPRMVLGLEELARRLHPDRFPMDSRR